MALVLVHGILHLVADMHTFMSEKCYWSKNPAGIAYGSPNLNLTFLGTRQHGSTKITSILLYTDDMAWRVWRVNSIAY